MYNVIIISAEDIWTKHVWYYLFIHLGYDIGYLIVFICLCSHKELFVKQQH